MTDETCSTCRYWKAGSYRLGDSTLTGACRRKPPVPLALDATDQALACKGHTEMVLFEATSFPQTAADDWCGKHRVSQDVLDTGAAERMARQSAEAEAKVTAASDSEARRFDHDTADDEPF